MRFEPATVRLPDGRSNHRAELCCPCWCHKITSLQFVLFSVDVSCDWLPRNSWTKQWDLLKTMLFVSMWTRCRTFIWCGRGHLFSMKHVFYLFLQIQSYETIVVNAGAFWIARWIVAHSSVCTIIMEHSGPQNAMWSLFIHAGILAGITVYIQKSSSFSVWPLLDARQSRCVAF